MAIPTRQQWQTFRDKNKVPKGVGKGAVGETLDKLNKTLADLMGAVEVDNAVKLIDKATADFKKYKESIGKSYPDFAKQLDKFLFQPLAEQKADLQQFLTNLKLIKGIVDEIPGFLKKFRAAVEGGKKSDISQSRKSLVEILASLAPIVNKCSNIDTTKTDVWQKLGKYGGAGKILAQAFDKTEKACETEKDDAKLKKLEDTRDHQLDEIIDTLNKIVVSAAPLK